jgi:Flp pilus assembly protein TadD
LLGDSRLLVTTADAFGAAAPAYRAPLAVKTLGAVGDACAWLVPVGASLALLSIACGLLTAWFVSLACSPRSAALAFLLVFLQPLGFVYWGHVETYPLLNAALAGVIALLARDYRDDRLRPVTVGAMGFLGLIHFVGYLVPLAVLLAPPPALARQLRPWVRWSLTAAGAIGAIVLGWEHTLIGFPAAGASRLSYLVEVVQGVLFALVPIGFAVWGAASPDPFRRCLRFLLAGFLLVPIGFRLERGAYGDLDILSPVAVPLAVLILLEAGSDTRRRRRVLVLLLAGLPLLAGVLTAQRSEGGLAFMERYLARASLAPGSRAYGFEILAYTRAELGDPRGGAGVMRRALEQTPGNHRLWGGLGELQLAAGDTATAIQSMERSLDTPRRTRTLALLLELLVRRGDPGRAADLVAAYPGEVAYTSGASAAACVAYIRLGQPGGAEVVARRRLDADPGDDLAWFNLASAFNRQGRGAEAAEAMREAVRLAPEDPRYQELLQRLEGSGDGR